MGFRKPKRNQTQEWTKNTTTNDLSMYDGHMTTKDLPLFVLKNRVKKGEILDIEVIMSNINLMIWMSKNHSDKIDLDAISFVVAKKADFNLLEQLFTYRILGKLAIQGAYMSNKPNELAKWFVINKFMSMNHYAYENKTLIAKYGKSYLEFDMDSDYSLYHNSIAIGQFGT